MYLDFCRLSVLQLHKFVHIFLVSAVLSLGLPAVCEAQSIDTRNRFEQLKVKLSLSGPMTGLTAEGVLLDGNGHIAIPVAVTNQLPEEEFTAEISFATNAPQRHIPFLFTDVHILGVHPYYPLALAKVDLRSGQPSPSVNQHTRENMPECRPVPPTYSDNSAVKQGDEVLGLSHRTLVESIGATDGNVEIALDNDYTDLSTSVRAALSKNQVFLGVFAERRSEVGPNTILIPADQLSAKALDVFVPTEPVAMNEDVRRALLAKLNEGEGFKLRSKLVNGPLLVDVRALLRIDWDNPETIISVAYANGSKTLVERAIEMNKGTPKGTMLAADYYVSSNNIRREINDVMSDWNKLSDESKRKLEIYFQLLLDVLQAGDPATNQYAAKALRQLAESYESLRIWPEAGYTKLWHDQLSDEPIGLDYQSEDLLWFGWDDLSQAQRQFLQSNPRSFSKHELERFGSLGTSEIEEEMDNTSTRSESQTKRSDIIAKHIQSERAKSTPIPTAGLTVPTIGPFNQCLLFYGGAYVLVNPIKDGAAYLEYFSTITGQPLGHRKLSNERCVYAVAEGWVFILDPIAATLTRWDPIEDESVVLSRSKLLRNAVGLDMGIDRADLAFVTAPRNLSRHTGQNNRPLRTFSLDLETGDTPLCIDWRTSLGNESQRWYYPYRYVNVRLDASMVVVNGDAEHGELNPVVLDSHGRWVGHEENADIRFHRGLRHNFRYVKQFSPNLLLSHDRGVADLTPLTRGEEPKQYNLNVNNPTLRGVVGLFVDSDRYILANESNDNQNTIRVFDVQAAQFLTPLDGWMQIKRNDVDVASKGSLVKGVLASEKLERAVGFLGDPGELTIWPIKFD